MTCRDDRCERCAAPLLVPGARWCGPCWQTVEALTEERFSTTDIESERS